MRSGEQEYKRFSIKSLIPEFITGAGFAAWILIIILRPMPIWGDEFFTFLLSSVTLQEAIQAALNDAHPPLYWIITNTVMWSTVDDILVLRIVSAMFGVFAIWITSLILTESMSDSVNKNRIRIVFLILALSSPFAILFFSMARYYSLFAFLVSLSFYLKMRHSRSWFATAGIVITDTLMLYTNFIAGLVLLASWVFMMIRKTSRPFKSQMALIITIPLLLFSPLFIYMIQTIQKLATQDFFQADFAIGIKSLIIRLAYCWHVFISGEFIYPWQPSGIIMAMVSVFLFALFLLKGNRDAVKLIAIGILIPVLILVLSSISLFSLGMEFLPSRIAFAQVFIIMAIVIGLYTIKHRLIFNALLIILLLGNLHADMKLIQRENFLHSTYIIPWHEIKEEIKSDASFVTDIMLYDDAAFEYELIQNGILPQAYNVSSLDFDIRDLTSQHPDKRIWMVYSPRDITPDGKIDDILDYLNAQNYTIELHKRYVEESDSAVKTKERLLGREVEKYKKELMLFKPATYNASRN